MTGAELLLLVAVILGVLGILGVIHLWSWGYFLASMCFVVMDAAEEKPPEEKP